MYIFIKQSRRFVVQLRLRLATTERFEIFKTFENTKKNILFDFLPFIISTKKLKLPSHFRVITAI